MDDLIVRTVTKWIVPFIQVYGIFIILHGHISPGGGFSGGAVLGSSIILITLSLGYKKASGIISHSTSALLESGSIIWYVLIGIVGIISGNNFLTNRGAGFYMGEVGDVISSGMIPLITVAIGIKVASTVITLFHTIIEED
ncbi:MAG: sodium:proton antiporter [Alkaliphilus sp.]|nr:MnhB domain-containing protein [bacterium AH-315-L21]MBN4069429.1 MnhB domain-containing protein [bacterium AH-315-G05]MBN4074488.1 MnhB domain-containing protein [bacterium AH-315-E09]PHS30633.1 MAG: sodium:proton antiporter [Alkaliphilus sp.]